MRIAVAQVTSTTRPEENLEIIDARAREAAATGAELVVFPEAMMASFAIASKKVAEPLDGPWATRVRQIADERGITIALGMFVATDDPERPLNTLFVTGPGTEETTYDKLHLFDVGGFKESDHITPGNETVMFSVGGITIGCAICYDVRFPALFQHYANAGAHVVIVPTSWATGEGKAAQFHTLCTARAMDSTTYIVGAGQADPKTCGKSSREGVPTGVGGSVVVDPNGTVLVEAGPAPELLIADIDPAVVAAARENLPLLEGARFTSTFDA